MLSVEERTDDIVVLCLNYTGIVRGTHIRPACGYDTRWHVNFAPRTGRGEHPGGTSLGCGASSRSAGRGDRLRRPPDLRAGHQRRAARSDPDVHHSRTFCRTASGSTSPTATPPSRPSRSTARKRPPVGACTLFNTLASNWGVQAVEDGKIVWFELPVEFPVAPSSVSDGSFRFNLTGVDAAEPARRAASTRRKSPSGSSGYRWPSCRSRVSSTRRCSASSG